MDVRGCLGLSDDYRNGFERIRVTFRVEGDAPPEKLREVVERAPARARPSTTWSPTACPSTSRSPPAEPARAGPPCAVRPRRPSRTEIPCHRTDRQDAAGARLSRSPRRSPTTSPTRAAAHDRDGSYPYASIDALRDAGYFAAPIPERARRAGRRLGPRPRRRLQPPRARRRLGRHRRQHAPRRGAEHGPPLAHRRGRAATTGAPPRSPRPSREIARERRGAGRGGQRARPGPHAPGDDRHAHRRRLAHRRPQDLLHDVAGGDRRSTRR